MGEVARVEGQATYTSGAPVANGQVTARLRAGVEFAGTLFQRTDSFTHGLLLPGLFDTIYRIP